MSQPARTGRPNRAAAAALEKRLRQAAFEVFRERGFEGATMEEIARAANITKRTLYAKYPDKRALFVKVLSWALSTSQQDMPMTEGEHDDLRAALVAVAETAVARATDPEVAQLTRVAMSEAHRFPEFGTGAQTMTWAFQMRSVIDLLERHATAGDIVVDDPALAAEQFLAMVAGLPTILAVFGVHRPTDVERRHIEHAVGLFLSGVEPRGPRASRSAWAGKGTRRRLDPR